MTTRGIQCVRAAPNNSFKPTPCRGVGRVLYATLAHVRRPATGRLNSGVRPLKTVVSILVAIAAFIFGCIATLFAMLRIFAPPANCTSPCDAPGYVAVGAAFFVGPLVGALCTWGALHALRRLRSRRSRSTA